MITYLLLLFIIMGEGSITIGVTEQSGQLAEINRLFTDARLPQIPPANEFERDNTLSLTPGITLLRFKGPGILEESLHRIDACMIGDDVMAETMAIAAKEGNPASMSKRLGTGLRRCNVEVLVEQDSKAQTIRGLQRGFYTLVTKYVALAEAWLEKNELHGKRVKRVEAGAEVCAAFNDDRNAFAIDAVSSGNTAASVGLRRMPKVPPVISGSELSLWSVSHPKRTRANAVELVEHFRLLLTGTLYARERVMFIANIFVGTAPQFIEELNTATGLNIVSPTMAANLGGSYSFQQIMTYRQALIAERIAIKYCASGIGALPLARMQPPSEEARSRVSMASVPLREQIRSFLPERKEPGI